MLFLGCSLQQDRTGLIIAALAARNRAMRHYAVLEYPASQAEKRVNELARICIRPIWFPPKQYERIELVLAYLADLLPEPLRRVKKKPETIPRNNTEFVGRREEQSDLRAMILQRRLVTVAGPPGAGKTRLTIEVARSVQAEFDGTWFVTLSQLSDARVIPQRIANVMQLKLGPDADFHESVAAALKPGQQLLILDNCETALDECAGIARKLLDDCPDLHLVLTSRILLGDAVATGTEYVYETPPLKAPDANHLPDLADLARVDSIKLLLKRVQTHSRTFRLTKENAKKAAQLCQRLEGIPLAIELVAAQMRRATLDSVLADSHYLDFKKTESTADHNVQSITLRQAIKPEFRSCGFCFLVNI